MKLRRISLAVLSVLLSAVTALSGFMVYTQLSGRQKEKEEFDTLAEMVEVTPEKPNDETAVPTDDTSKPVRDLSGLFSQNGDCIGWLCIPDTAVNYPVMHTPENPQKYLRRSFYGEYSQSGVPFLDRRCGLNSDNLIIYGHNMKTGTIFGCLTEYRKADYYQEHPFIEFDTVYGDAKYEVFGAFTIDVVNDTSFIYNQYIDMDEDTYNRYVDQVISRSDVDSGIRPAYGEQLLTLSTCEYSSANGRYVVVARRVSD